MALIDDIVNPKIAPVIPNIAGSFVPRKIETSAFVPEKRTEPMMSINTPQFSTGTIVPEFVSNNWIPSLSTYIKSQNNISQTQESPTNIPTPTNSNNLGDTPINLNLAGFQNTFETPVPVIQTLSDIEVNIPKGNIIPPNQSIDEQTQDNTIPSIDKNYLGSSYQEKDPQNPTGAYIKNKEELQDLIEQRNKDQADSMSILNNPVVNWFVNLFPSNQLDFENAIVDAQTNIYQSQYEKDLMKDQERVGGMWGALLDVVEVPKDSKFYQKELENYNKSINIANKTSESLYLQSRDEKKSIKNLENDKKFVKEATKLLGANNIEEILQRPEQARAEIVGYADNAMKGLIKSLPGGLTSNRIDNIGVVTQAIVDVAREIAPYNTNHLRAIESAELQGNTDVMIKATLQKETNNKKYIDKQVEKIKVITERRNIGDSTVEAERFFAEYVKEKGFDSVNAFFLEGSIDERGDEITKDRANSRDWSLTRKDQQILNDSVNKTALSRGFSFAKGLAGVTLQRGAAIAEISISNAIANSPKVLKYAGSAIPLVSTVATYLPNRLWSEAATADSSNTYGLSLTDQKTGMFEKIVPKFWNKLGDKGVAAVVQVVPFVLSGGGSAVMKVGQVKNAINGLSIAKKAYYITKNVAQLTAREGALNIMVDAQDINSGGQGNAAANVLGSMLGVSWDMGSSMRLVKNVNNPIVLSRIQTNIKNQGIENILKESELAGKKITRDEAIQRYELLPDHKKPTVEVTNQSIQDTVDLKNEIEQIVNSKERVLKNNIKNSSGADREVYQIELAKLQREQKSGFVNQRMTGKLLSGEKLSQTDVVAFSRLLKDVENPKAALPDMIRVMETLPTGSTKSSLANTIRQTYDGTLDNSTPIVRGSYEYEDGGIVSAYLSDKYKITPGDVYTKEFLTDILVNKINSSDKNPDIIKNLLRTGESGEFINFAKNGDGYILNESGLKQMNVKSVSEKIELQRSVLKEGEKTAGDLFNESLESIKDAVGASDDEIAKIKELRVFDRLNSIVDEFIPCNIA